jgi:hypothetical protein
LSPQQAKCRQQSRRVFEFFCDALSAHFQHKAAPSLRINGKP